MSNHRPAKDMKIVIILYWFIMRRPPVHQHQGHYSLTETHPLCSYLLCSAQNECHRLVLINKRRHIVSSCRQIRPCSLWYQTCQIMSTPCLWHIACAYNLVQFSHRCRVGNMCVALRWRHNERDGVSNHQPQDCLLNRLSGPRSKKTSKPRVTGLCAGIHRGPVNSPHKWPVTRKLFPFGDVIMGNLGQHWFICDKPLSYSMLAYC